MLKQKVKRALLQYHRGSDYASLGKSVRWRINLIDNLLPMVNRGEWSEDELIGKLAGFCLIRRQVEVELDLYQQQIQDLSLELENGEITEAEFQERLEDLTTAILIIALLAGSETIEDNQELFDNALLTLQTGGLEGGDDLDISGLPEQAQEDLNSEIAIALGASAGLVTAIASGKFEDNQEGLFGRLAMWVTTALGLVSLGKLFLDATRFQIWLYSPLKAHCSDCAALNGQVHTVAEWNEFFAQTGKRPQSRNLECKGFNCGCGLFDANGPSVGNFV